MATSTTGFGVSVEYDASTPVSAIRALTVMVINAECIPVAVKVVTQHADWYFVTPPKLYISPKCRVPVTILLRPPTSQSPHPDSLPLSDVLRFEFRAMVSVSVHAVKTLPIAEFADHWKRGVPQDPETAELKLQWLSLDEHAAFLVQAEEKKQAELQQAISKETAAAEAALAQVSNLRNRMKGYDEDMESALVRLEHRRSVVGIHWTVAVLTLITAFAAAAGPDRTLTLFLHRASLR